MYFGLSEEQEFFQDNVKKFLTDNASIDEIRKIASGEGQELHNRLCLIPAHERFWSYLQYSIC